MWLDPSKPQEIFQVSQHCPFLLNHVLNSNKASLQEYTNTHTRYLQPVKTEANHVLHFYCTLHDSSFTEDSKGRAEEGGWWRSEVWQAWNAQTARQTVQSSGACCPVWFLTLAFKEADTGGCGDHVTMKTESSTKPCTLWSLASTAGYTKERQRWLRSRM